jgi:enterochelin esterase-like enzyme
MTQASAAPSTFTDHREVVLTFAGRGVTAVALVHELTRPRRVPFRRMRPGLWTLRWPWPEADRVEYLLELTRRDGRRELVLDPANPLRAPGPFGEKSVLERPAYAPPAWVADEDSPAGDVVPHDLRTRYGPLPARLWSAVDADPGSPLPLLIVHDGPEYAELSALLRYLDHAVAFGEVPPLRALLLPPPGDRNDSYSASARYDRAFASDVAAAFPPTAHRPVVMGASLGALAALHLHWSGAVRPAGLFLQSGSFFRRRTDRFETGFPRFGRVSRFVGRVLGGRGAPEPVPIVMTCGTAEENLANNRVVARALGVELVEHRDAHNWVSWRDVLQPHLTDLLLRAWT